MARDSPAAQMPRCMSKAMSPALLPDDVEDQCFSPLQFRCTKIAESSVGSCHMCHETTCEWLGMTWLGISTAMVWPSVTCSFPCSLEYNVFFRGMI